MRRLVAFRRRRKKTFFALISPLPSAKPQPQNLLRLPPPVGSLAEQLTLNQVPPSTWVTGALPFLEIRDADSITHAFGRATDYFGQETCPQP